jgi:hypothetical protein
MNPPSNHDYTPNNLRFSASNGSLAAVADIEMSYFKRLQLAKSDVREIPLNTKKPRNRYAIT